MKSKKESFIFVLGTTKVITYKTSAERFILSGLWYTFDCCCLERLESFVGFDTEKRFLDEAVARAMKESVCRTESDDIFYEFLSIGIDSPLDLELNYIFWNNFL